MFYGSLTYEVYFTHMFCLCDFADRVLEQQSDSGRVNGLARGDT